MSAPGTDLQSWRWLRGRSRRREYWLWLVVILAWMAALGAAGDTPAVQVLWWALMFAITRRLHDIGLGAEWIVVTCLLAISLGIHATRTGQGWAAIAGDLAVGGALIALGLVRGQRDDNRFGPPRKPRNRSPVAA